MKKLSFLLIFATLFTFSCSKEEVKATNETTNSLVGEWRWISSTGGIAGKTITPSTAGYERRLVLTSDLKFSRYKDNKLEISGTYQITQGKSIYKPEQVDFIKFSDSTSAVIMSQTADELSLADNFYDGFSESYQRIKK
ncbi:hypothetical protein Emtol_1958 [Emticicia oligotrophica DSM 17448]|uniref:Lipocalin-like domain-containing protein n=1 Tax=Emticicia oligotrophica (strain DSM 17448 / CIP 109782 / MTCC 6937 / GPTSA100-15) TaxID=929562 RepID=A0ABN4ALA7_EMTOG|nr:hypothetical protein [Emticicia oligotrophica]AFK03098.1 hypothetical protein Emtol_1958 [Emticicia oligotrophica DSM 17448]